MAKRVPKLSDERLHDIWNVRSVVHGEGAFDAFDKLISSAVARCLREDDGDRDQQSKHLSFLLGEDVSVDMLNAYASEARREHRIPASRFLVLIAMTRRFDILDAVLREVGGKALDRRDAQVFRVGVDYVTSVEASRALSESVADVVTPI